MSRIRLCTKDDLDHVLEWLKVEDKAGIPGCFYCNRNVIKESFKNDGMWVLDEGPGPIAFLVGGNSGTGIDILAVKNQYRRSGYGKEMADFFINNLRKKNVPLVRVDCQPNSSISFWKKLGFELYVDTFKGVTSSDDLNRAFLRIGQSNHIELDWVQVPVEICFYPENAKYKKKIKPIVVFNPMCFQKSVGEIVLKDRIIFYHPSNFEARDVVVAIAVNGKQLYMDKAKYEDGAIFGLSKQSNDLFWFDRVLLPIV